MTIEAPELPEVVTNAEAEVYAAQVEILREAVSDLERALEEPGWVKLTNSVTNEFSRDGLRQMCKVVRAMTLANPLIRRALALRVMYVWGQGVNITARDGEGDGQDVNAVIQEFLDEPGNRAAFSGQQAREEAERELFTDGQGFYALFTRPVSGKVQVRPIPVDQIDRIITNPDDQTEAWYYKRVWVRVDEKGNRSERVDYYPALRYRPQVRPRTDTDGNVIHWDSPVIHLRANTMRGWLWGIPDGYTAVDWARAYREFLADWARLVKALSRFAWQMTAKSSKHSAMSAAIRRKPSTGGDGQASEAGATAILPPDMRLEAVPKTGATIDASSGRPLAMMVAAATDVPITMLMGDPGSTGARATAETLDRPTELGAMMRQSLHGAFLSDVCEFVILQAVKAPQGPLKGTVTRDPETGRETVTLTGDVSPTVDIDWPPVEELDVTQAVAAITQADQTEKLPEKLTAQLLMHALGVTDVDEWIDEMLDDDGNWVGPQSVAAQTAAAQAARGVQLAPGLLVGDPTPPPADAAAQAAQAAAGNGG